MGRDDWFRNKKWNAATEAHFNEKPRRARDKAQPLRIQTHHLQNADPKATLIDLPGARFSMSDDCKRGLARSFNWF
jgi:hypothetical protein